MCLKLTGFLPRLVFQRFNLELMDLSAVYLANLVKLLDAEFALLLAGRLANGLVQAKGLIRGLGLVNFLPVDGDLNIVFVGVVVLILFASFAVTVTLGLGLLIGFLGSSFSYFLNSFFLLSLILVLNVTLISLK